MIDRENVIYNIERCISHVPDACRDCSKYGTWDAMVCMEELLSDALELLKEQEPLVIHKCGFTATCPECNLSWMMWQPDYMRYCPYCGKAVKWDE